MQIVFKQNKTPLNRAYRDLTTIATVDGTLKEGFDVFNPTITVNYNAAYYGVNYASIADFGRNYYITEPPSIEGDLMVIKMHADTLMNFLPVILNSDCIAERSSSNFNMFLKDSALLGEVGYKYFSRSFVGGESFTPGNGKYILMTGGR